MTVEHLIGKSQGGYLKQIYESVRDKLPGYPELKVEAICKEIDSFNTVSACQFCNSTDLVKLFVTPQLSRFFHFQ